MVISFKYSLNLKGGRILPRRGEGFPPKWNPDSFPYTFYEHPTLPWALYMMLDAIVDKVH